MAVQYDPIAKDESLNTTEATPRNIADVLAEELSGIASALNPAQLASLADVTISSPSDGQTLKYDSVTQKWVNANDAGGHIIENPSGTDMTQRGNLQFVDAHLTDDGGNDSTEVEIAKEVTEADFDTLNPQGTEHDGVYLMEVAGATPLTADMVGYDGGTVKGSLDEIDIRVDNIEEEVQHLSGLNDFQISCPLLSGCRGVLLVTRYGIFTVMVYDSGANTETAYLGGQASPGRSITSTTWNNDVLTVAFSGGMYGGVTAYMS